MSTPQPTQLTFVVQGAIARSGGFSTRQVCAAIRLVLSDNPGPLPYRHNTNRQPLSSCEGVRWASNDLVMKVRGNVLFVSDSVLAFWERWTNHADGLRIVEHRVLVPSIFTRRPSLLAPLPFHLHAAADGYVVLHGACEGHVRLARRAGNAVLQPGDVATWVAAAVRPAA